MASIHVEFLEVFPFREPTHPYPSQEGTLKPLRQAKLPSSEGLGVGSESPCAREVQGGLSQMQWQQA